jgi:hypothetical protein
MVDLRILANRANRWPLARLVGCHLRMQRQLDLVEIRPAAPAEIKGQDQHVDTLGQVVVGLVDLGAFFLDVPKQSLRAATWAEGAK